MPVAVDQAYSYAVPPGLNVQKGDYVQVPLGLREVWGIVDTLREDRVREDEDRVRIDTGQAAAPPPKAPQKPDALRWHLLKPILAKADLAPLPPLLHAFLHRLAEYTLAPLGLVFKLAMADPEADLATPPVLAFYATGQPLARPTPTRTRLLAAAQAQPGLTKKALAEHAGCSTGVIDALLDEGALQATALRASAVALHDLAQRPLPSLSMLQQQAAQTLVRAVECQAFAPFLLEGVTGSGKTEVYFEAVAQALAQGQQALILLPEIALTTQFMTRFEARFGAPPALWHSEVSPKKREILHRAVQGAACAGGKERAQGQKRAQGVADAASTDGAQGRAKTGLPATSPEIPPEIPPTVPVVVGARSALFLPFERLGLIVVDEEHEPAFKQEEGVRYNARDMAVLRAKLEGCPIVLASATPSIETRVNADQGRYTRLQLPDRAAGRAMPTLRAIDLRRDPPDAGNFLSPVLVQAAAQTLAKGEQVLFFLNRRGYAPLTLCRACGHRWQCPNCDAALVEHRFRRALICHHCGHTERRPTHCSACGTEGQIAACGPGIERIAEELRAHFPSEPQIVLSSDLPGGNAQIRTNLEAIERGDARLIIGTQLIAKGHNFPLLTLAAIVDADIGLGNTDPRAAERSFQLFSQVTGRAGRAERPGIGLLQTVQPDHAVIRALLSGEAERFYATEIRARALGGMPPFGRLAALTISAREKEAAEAHARKLTQAGHQLLRTGWAAQSPAGLAAQAVQAVPRDNMPREDVRLLGPAEPPLAFLRGKHRLRLIVKTSRAVHIQPFIRALIAAAGPARNGARLDVDIDPMSFY